LGDFESWIPERRHYIDAATQAAIERADRKRIRRAQRWFKVRTWLAILSFCALCWYGVLYFLKVL